MSAFEILAHNCPTAEQIEAEPNPGEQLRMRFVRERVITRSRDIERRAGRPATEAEQVDEAQRASRDWAHLAGKPGTQAARWSTDPEAARAELTRRRSFERSNAWVEISAVVAPVGEGATGVREFTVRDRACVARDRLAAFLNSVPDSVTGFEVRVTSRPAEKTDEEDKREQKREADEREAVNTALRFGNHRSKNR